MPRSGAFIATCAFLACLLLLALLAHWLVPADPYRVDPLQAFLPPSGQHWFGTDGLGRDVFARVMYGARVSLAVGFITVAISSTLGVALGMTAGWFGSWVDSALMRLVDIVMSIPTFFLILSVVAFLKPGIGNIILILGLTSWMGTARLMRAETMRIRDLDYILAARIAGTGGPRMLLRHVLPNAIAPVVVTATLGVAGAIMAESGLSFLGLGVQPPTASWGSMLRDGKETLDLAWWISIFPGLAILLTVLSLNVLGESLRQYLDPRGATL